MKGKLNLKNGEWVIACNKLVNIFYPVKSENLYRYDESFKGLDVEYEVYLTNKSGRVFKHIDTSTNFSEAIWVAKVDESDFKWKDFAKNDVLVENDGELLINECWEEYKGTLQDSQYMARLNLSKSEMDFKSGARLMFEKINRK